MTRTYLALALLLLGAISSAADSPAVRIRTRLDPAASVVIGEPVKLYVDVLTDAFFIQAPELPPLEIPGVIVKLSDERPPHLNESSGGKTWYGIEHYYLLTPIVASTFDVPPFDVTTYPGPSGKPVTAHAQAKLQLRVSAPPGADGAFATRDLKIRQSIEGDPASLKVGDALTRSVELIAIGTPAMFIPRVELGQVDGLAAYPQTPGLQDATLPDGPVGQRSEKTTYIVQRPGSFSLPAIEVRWWDLDAKTLKTATAPAVRIEALAAPPPKPAFAVPTEVPQAAAKKPFDWFTAGLYAASVIVLLIVLRWLIPIATRAARSLHQRRREQRLRYLDSEDHAFRQLRNRLRRGDDAEIPAALYRWLDRLPRPLNANVDYAATVATHATLAWSCESLLQCCYDGNEDRSAARSSRNSLQRSLQRARQEILNDAHRAGTRTAPLPSLNP